MKLRVTIDSQTFEVEVGDLKARPVLATIDGETFEVWPEGAEESTQAAAPAPRPATTAAAAATATTAAAARPAVAPGANGGDKSRGVLAPIPGVIISVTVKPGDTVVFGQELCVLEAMKMKNLIRANRPGTIAKICVETGDQVRHGQVLLEYSD